jgi:hypothetical protein
VYTCSLAGIKLRLGIPTAKIRNRIPVLCRRGAASITGTALAAFAGVRTYAFVATAWHARTVGAAACRHHALGTSVATFGLVPGLSEATDG